MSGGTLRHALQHARSAHPHRPQRELQPSTRHYSRLEMMMPTFIFSTEFPDWDPNQPTAEWPHLFLVKFYAMMERIAMEGSPEQRRHMRFFAKQLHKEASGPARPYPRDDGRN